MKYEISSVSDEHGNDSFSVLIPGFKTKKATKEYIKKLRQKE